VCYVICYLVRELAILLVSSSVKKLGKSEIQHTIAPLRESNLQRSEGGERGSELRRCTTPLHSTTASHFCASCCQLPFQKSCTVLLSSPFLLWPVYL